MQIDEGSRVAYESESFKEHHQARLPVLEALLVLGWERSQIQCPPDDREWRVPKNPSSAAAREKGRSFDGYPVDIALFDSSAGKGDWRHANVIIECKTPGDSSGLSELETYMGLEPKVRLGVLTDGARVTRVYKLPSGEFSVEESSTLPAPGDNLIRRENVAAGDLAVPTLSELSACFEDLLALIASSDGRTTRPDARLNQVCNLLLLKLQSDADARMTGSDQVDFQVHETPTETAEAVNSLFRRYKSDRRDLFSDDEADEIVFDAVTIHAAVAELQRKDLVDVAPDVLSLAFQIFRDSNLKVGNGQYFTPGRVVAAATSMMCIDVRDKVIDPACGTGGFLGEAYLQVASKVSEADAVRWANARLYGVDLDDINVKLARALMVGMGDGSTHVKLGDSVRESRWGSDRHGLTDALAADSYDVVLTNPPFGKDLVVSSADAAAAGLTICRHTPAGKVSSSYAKTEIGIVFVERAYRLLHDGGRLGIVLPETYFFSKSYEWFREWMDERFILKGVLNIPMEAFQGFCRAKTNFYVFTKVSAAGTLPVGTRSPAWFLDGRAWVSNAPTIGINKDGETLYRLDPETMTRTSEVDDAASADVHALLEGCGETDTARYVRTEPISESLIGVPQYCDRTSADAASSWIAARLPGCSPMTLGELCVNGLMSTRAGHGSPSADFRVGDVPYIKVSDLRNGQVNPNDTNRVPLEVARRFWRGDDSGLAAYDVLTPARTSKNIGEPSVLLPGQEHSVLTKEILILRASAEAPFDNFYLAWALMLPCVRAQWSRVVFMQTNREDLGDRWREIVVPVPADKSLAEGLSEPVRTYYTSLASIKQDLASSIQRWSEA